MNDKLSADVRFKSLSDEAFVERAYALLLGRLPDQGGIAHYVGRLRSGERRSRIWESLLASPERVSAMHSSAPVTTPHRLEDVLRLEQSAFVQAAYVYVLGRRVDSGGLSNYLRRLKEGSGKLQLLSELQLSAEGQLSRRTLPELDNAVRDARASLWIQSLRARPRQLLARVIRR